MKHSILFLDNSFTYAQVGIGTTNPDASSALDISATNKGLLIPRIALTGSKDKTTIENPAIGLLIYNTAVTTSTIPEVSPGYYSWSGTAWVRFMLFSDIGLGRGYDDNIFMGYEAGFSNTTSGKRNIFLGIASGFSKTIGKDNIFMGLNTGSGNTTGRDNVMLGPSAGFNNTTGISNVFIGAGAGYANTTGISNVFIGVSAGFNNTTGSTNIAIGKKAGFSLSGGADNEKSSNSIFLGIDTKSGSSNSTNEVVIGNLAEGKGTNTITIGNTAITDTYLHGNIFAGNTNISTPDYVFEKYYNGFSALKDNYKMMSLKEVESFTRKNKHLPGVLSAKAVKEQGGIILNRTTTTNLEKIEELFLHAITQEKELKAKDKKIKELENRIAKIEGSYFKIKTILHLK
ncbi:MAG: hypothetical protein ACWIPJ_07795 [Polaribacter sp.]